MAMKEIHRRIYEYIKQRTEDGCSPSIREICRDLDISSTSTAARYVNFLVEEGYLEKIDNLNRTLRLAGGKAVRLPVAGTITAGQPVTAFEDVAEYISFVPKKNYTGELFALKIRGESMIDAGILDGDYVIIEKTDFVENGTIAAVMVGSDEATVKTFFKEDGHYRLQPENEAMEPIITDKCSIIGRVVGVMRYM